MAAAVALGLAGGACSSGSSSAVTTTTRTASTSSTTAAPSFAGDPRSAFCTLLGGIDTSTVLGTGDPGDPAAVEAAFRRLVGVLRQALAVAPSEIASDLSLVSEGIAALDRALAEVGYDFDALAASTTAQDVVRAVNDPAFTDAGSRLGAYRTQVCGL